MTTPSSKAPHRGRVLHGAPCWVLATLGLLMGGGCANEHHDLVGFLRSHESEVATGSYVVRPPDSLIIHAPGASEIDGTGQMVRADGKIVLRLLGEVDVAGLTTAEIAEKLKAQLSRYYVDPEVAVQVTNYNSQFYYVFGEVAGAGPKRFTGRDTLLMALAEARPTRMAWRSQIRVTRPAPVDGEQKVIVIDLDKITQKGDLSMNILLQAGDIVEVPPTPLAWVGHRLRELLYPVEPVMQTYTTPSQMIDATHTYEDEFGDTGDNNEGWRRRFGR